MKKIIIILFISVSIFSCDKSVTTSYEIVNEASEKISMAFYSSGNETNHEIASKSSYLLFTDGGLGDDIKMEVTEDSVIVKTISNRMIKYYKDKIGNDKTIYNESFWEKKEIKKRNFIYSFTIKEEDFND